MGIVISVLIVSASFGACCAILGKGRIAALCAGGVPWLFMLAFLLYGDHVLGEYGIPAPYTKDTMWWPEQQLYFGTIVAVFGLMGYGVTAVRWTKPLPPK